VWNQDVVNNPIPWSTGTWTPTIGGAGGQSGQVYSAQLGTYVKIGELVFVSYQLGLSTLGTITGDVQLKGLPFAASAALLQYTGAHYFADLTTSVASVSGHTNLGSTVVNLQYAPAAGATDVSNFVQGDLANTTGFIGGFCYRATA